MYLYVARVRSRRRSSSNRDRVAREHMFGDPDPDPDASLERHLRFAETVTGLATGMTGLALAILFVF